MYRTLKGTIDAENISSQTLQYNINLNQEFYLPKDFKIQFWCSYRSGFTEGIQYFFPRNAIHLSVSKLFLDQKLSVTLSLQDLLYKDYMSLTSTLSDQF
jgi:hypothetical protein